MKAFWGVFGGIFIKDDVLLQSGRRRPRGIIRRLISFPIVEK
jgi:hypothetical protein